MTQRSLWPLLAGALSVGAANAQSQFGDPIEVSRTLASSGDDMVAVDINHDGYVDLVAPHAPASGLRILLGRGDLTFDEPYDLPLVAGRPKYLTVGDFNTDGRMDIAVGIDLGPDRIVWVQNTGTALPSVRAVDLSTPSFHEMVAADVDGDGDPDLVVRQFGGVVFYRNLGGAFDPTPVPVTDGATDVMECADLNGDGRSDIIIGRRQWPSSQPFDWMVYMANTAGTHSQGVGFLPPSIGSVRGLRAFDWDLDGDQDLMAFLPVTDEMTVLELVGPLNYVAAQTDSLAGLHFIAKPQVVDVDGDGLEDVLYTGDHPQDPGVEFQWRRNLGAAGFAPSEVALEGTLLVNGTVPYRMGVADLNGDGIPEAYAEQSDYVMRIFSASNSGSGARFSGGISPTVDPASLRSPRLADIDLDGDLDIVSLQWPGSEPFWFENLGAFCFRAAEQLLSDTGGATLVAIEDFDQDGAIDFLFEQDRVGGPGPAVEISIRRGLTFPHFAPPETVGIVDGRVVKRSVSDADGDGDLDLLLVAQDVVELNAIVFRNDVTAFDRTQILSGIPPSSRFVFVDANQDSMTDMVESSVAGASVRLNVGGLTFAAPVAFQGAAGSLALDGVLDLDGDGIDDILGAGWGLYWFWAKGDGVGSFQPFTRLVDVRKGTGIRTGDVNGDGFMDAVVGSAASGGGDAVLYLGQPLGTFVESESIFSNVALQVISLDLQDLDGDGDADLMMNAFGTPFVSEGNETQDAGGAPVTACVNNAENSLGCQGSLRALGTPSTTATDLELFASALPPHQFGMFIGSTDLTTGVRPANSSGFLCLTGTMGRYDGPGQIGTTGPSGTLRLPLDPTRLESALGQVPAVAGATWGFQAWHRDLTEQGVPTSNFTTAVAITFQP